MVLVYSFGEALLFLALFLLGLVWIGHKIKDGFMKLFGKDKAR